MVRRGIAADRPHCGGGTQSWNTMTGDLLGNVKLFERLAKMWMEVLKECVEDLAIEKLVA
jgi:hypothetical protein